MRPRLYWAFAYPCSAARRYHFTASAWSYAGYAIPVVVHEAEVVLGFRVPLLGSQAIPLHRLGVVLGYAIPVVVHEAEVVLGFRPLLG